MLGSVLIANRGEIACRIIRTARRLGIRTVAVYSEADANALHVRQADSAVAIGAAPARESYLRGDTIIEAAKASGADAIHPGYGFLSENAEFAQAVMDAGLIWIGPKPHSISAMGLKDAAKQLMIDAKVPVTPGYLGADQSDRQLRKEADKIGYPLLIKAVAGGGGKGMRRVDASAEFQDMLESCRREAAAAFGDDRVILEKFVTRPRHIEVQVFGDSHGNVVHLFERDCSLQRRHQKVIEEAPAPGMDAATREAVCTAAVRAAKAVDYAGAGTIEFIADVSEGLRADRIWFMEMNTRLQVEHPVTESITGQDLVEWQFRVASGEPLPMRQEQLSICGWAMEARLYAENPTKDFLPSTGPLDRLHIPQGERIETGVEQGDEVSSYYDPMIAKLVVHRPDREQAAHALAELCKGVEVWPVRTNAAFLARCAAHPDFLAGDVDTGFIADHAETLIPDAEPSERVIAAAASALLPKATGTPWTNLIGLRANTEPRREVSVTIGGTSRVATPEPDGHAVMVRGQPVLFLDGEAWSFDTRAGGAAAGATLSDGSILAPMPGRIIEVEFAEGAAVTKGQRLLVLEAMKMEHALLAPFDGIVKGLTAVAGGQVSEGTLLAKVEKD